MRFAYFWESEAWFLRSNIDLKTTSKQEWIPEGIFDANCLHFGGKNRSNSRKIPSKNKPLFSWFWRILTSKSKGQIASLNHFFGFEGRLKSKSDTILSLFDFGNRKVIDILSFFDFGSGFLLHFSMTLRFGVSNSDYHFSLLGSVFHEFFDLLGAPLELS